MSRTGLNRSLEVSVSVRAGRTRITVSENLSNLLGATFGPIGGGMGGGGSGILSGVIAGALHAAWPLLIAIPAWLSLTYLTARTTYGRLSRRRLRELEHLADRVAAAVEEVVAESPRFLRTPS
jgi:hypothetical protein